MAYTAYIVAMLVLGMLPPPVPNGDFNSDSTAPWAAFNPPSVSSLGSYNMAIQCSDPPTVHGCWAVVDGGTWASGLWYAEEGNAAGYVWTTNPKAGLSLLAYDSSGVPLSPTVSTPVAIGERDPGWVRLWVHTVLPAGTVAGKLTFSDAGSFDDAVVVQDGKGGISMNMTGSNTPEMGIPNGDFANAWPEMNGAALDTTNPHSAPNCARLDGLGSLLSEQFPITPGSHTVNFWLRGNVGSGLLIYLDAYDADGNEIPHFGGDPSPTFSSGEDWQAVSSQHVVIPTNAATAAVEVIVGGIKSGNQPLWLDDFTVD